MINKTVGFICSLDTPTHIEDLNTKGLGGAETWILQMAIQFASHGYHVIIFNNNNYSLLYDIGGNIDILPMTTLDRICSYQYFEHMFVTRFFNNDIIHKLEEYNNCNNVYGIVHDIHLWNQTPFILHNKDSILTQEKINNNKWLKSHLRKIFFMSQWHIDTNKDVCKYDDSLVEIIGNGINIPNDITFEDRDNNMLWSSCVERGLNLFMDKIFPKVKEKLPEFKVYVASYNKDPELKSEYQDNIEYIGSLSKEQLYSEMRKHKVSFLPLVHWETFCITSIENIANGVIFLSPFKFGLQTIFKYFEPIMLKDGDFNDNEYCNYIANEIVDRINNYNQYINLQKILYSYIKENYSWENIYNKLHNIIKSYETNNSYYM